MGVRKKNAESAEAGATGEGVSAKAATPGNCDYELSDQSTIDDIFGRDGEGGDGEEDDDLDDQAIPEWFDPDFFEVHPVSGFAVTFGGKELSEAERRELAGMISRGLRTIFERRIVRDQPRQPEPKKFLTLDSLGVPRDL